MWRDHTFRQRNKATRGRGGIGQNLKKEGGKQERKSTFIKQAGLETLFPIWLTKFLQKAIKILLYHKWPPHHRIFHLPWNSLTKNKQGGHSVLLIRLSSRSFPQDLHFFFKIKIQGVWMRSKDKIQKISRFSFWFALWLCLFLK